MASRRVFESQVFDDGVPVEAKPGIYVNKEAMVSLAQYGSPAKVFPFFLLISKNEVIKGFDLPDELSPLPPAEEVAQIPNLLDVGRWLDSISNIEDAKFAAQIGKVIFDRLPESYKQRAAEVS